MTAKEQAERIVDKFHKHHSQPHYQDAVAFGRIAVNEILEAVYDLVDTRKFWVEVKQEIEKL